MTADHNTAIEPLLVNVDTLCRLLSISRSSYFDLKARGLIGPVPVRLNHRLLFIRSEIESWLLARDPKTGQLPNRERWLAMRENL
jgi:predicted DNA-binding transcriptional regulator AlpA